MTPILIGEVSAGAAVDAVVPPAVVPAVVAGGDDLELELHAATRHMATIPANATFGLSRFIPVSPCCMCRSSGAEHSAGFRPGGFPGGIEAGPRGRRARRWPS